MFVLLRHRIRRRHARWHMHKHREALGIEERVRATRAKGQHRRVAGRWLGMHRDMKSS